MERGVEDGPPAPGTLIGVLEWRDRSGVVRRWHVRQGDRTNNWQFCPPGESTAKSRGMDWFFRRLRAHLARYAWRS